jgi:hypothetical protein
MLRIKRHEMSRPVTLLLDGLQGEESGFDVATALQHGLLQLLDAESKDIIVNAPKNTLPKARTIRSMQTGDNHNTIFHPGTSFGRSSSRTATHI